MKNVLLLAVFVLFASCSDSETKTYQGNFLATQDAAVLAVGDEMYAITMDNMTQTLAEQVKASQASEHDMVPVTIEALVVPRPVDTEGWDSILTIKKIIAVSPTAVAPDIKIEETNQ